MESKEKNYVGYEYKEIHASEKQLSFYLDCYESFGWEIDDRRTNTHGIISLKRQRKIANKTELKRLQRHFEACMGEIDRLEKSKNSKAVIAALSAGIIGCAFMAGSVFAITAETSMYILGTILAIPGFAGWALAPILYKKFLHTQTITIDQLIEDKYDEIDEICQKGSKLL